MAYFDGLFDDDESQGYSPRQSSGGGGYFSGLFDDDDDAQSLVDQYQKAQGKGKKKDDDKEDKKKVTFEADFNGTKVKQTVDKNEALNIWDEQDEAGKRVFADKVRERAEQGDEAAKQIDKWLKNEGRYEKGLGGETMDFIESSNERLLGLARAPVRLADAIIPGDQSAGAEEFMRRTGIQDRDQDPTKQTYTTGGSAGSAVGTTQKGLVDAFGLAAPAGVIDKAMKGTRAVQGLSQGGKLSQALGYGARMLPGSAAASTVEVGQEIGRGNEPNLARSFGIGAAVDLGLPVAGKYLKKGVQQGLKQADELLPENRVFNTLRDAADSAKTKLKKENWLRKGERNLVNPYAELARIDQKAARSMGIKPTDLNKKESLEHLADVSANMYGSTGRQVAVDTMESFKLNDVIAKYGEGTPAGKEFRNYQNMKFAVEAFDKKGKKIIKGSDIDDMRDAVEAYEAVNPDAITDNQRFKKWADYMLRQGEEAGVYEKGTADFVADQYDNYVPIDRVMPDELARPDIDTRSIGTLGRQQTLQNIEGSDLAISDSFDVFIDRGHAFVREKAKNNLFNTFKDRVEKGLVDGAEIVQSADDVLRMRELRENLEEIKGLKSKMKTAREEAIRERKSASTDLRYTRRDANNRVRELLRETVDDPDAAAAINDLNNDELFEIIDTMTDTGGPGTYQLGKSLRKSITNREKLLKEIDTLDEAMKRLDETKNTTRMQLAEVRPDPMTGKQILTGVDQGLPVKISVQPSVAKVLQGMDNDKLGVVGRILQEATRPFRTAFTGFLNPAFAAVSFAAYDAPMAVMNSKNGAKTLLSPKAWKESLESIYKTTDFEKKLREGGAMIQTASAIPDSSVASAEYLAAKGDLFKKIKVGVKPSNMKNLLSEIDIIGGKLSNATRTRVAKTAYDSALAKGLNESQAIAEAVYQFNNVMPNYNRASKTLRWIDAVLPYAAASVAGTRAAGQAIKRRPLKSLSKAALIASPAPLVVYHNMSHEAGQKYYEDMIEDGREYELDNNYVIVLPNAEENPETGDWDGIIKIPVPPEFRATNSMAWKQTRESLGGGEQESIKNMSMAAFDTITGGIFENPSNPAIETVAGLTANRNFDYDSDIVPDYMEDLPLHEQVFDSTSGLAKSIAGAIDVSPLQVQYVINQFGAGGRLVSRKSNPLEETIGRLVGSRSASANQEFQSEFSPLVDDKKSLSSAITRDLEDNNYEAASKKAREYNQRVANLQQAILEDPEGTNISEGQLSLLESLSFPVNERGGLSSSSVRARLDR